MTRVRNLTRMQRLRTCAAWRPDTVGYRDPVVATKLSLKSLARRILDINDEIAELDRFIVPLVEELAPSLLELEGVGTENAGAVMVAVGDNPDRLRSEASFAMMCGVCPIPASSGKTQRHRLNRGGNRQANSALHMVVVCRMRTDEADPSLCRSQDPGGAVQTRDHALPEALRGPRDLPRTHRPIECLTNMRAPEAANMSRSNIPSAWRKRASKPSVGSVGDSYDNALAETVNGLYKAEVIHRRGPWRSFEAVELVTLEWVDWFNNRRLLEPIGNIPPAEAEEHHYAMLEQSDMAV